MTMQKHELAALLLLTLTANVGVAREGFRVPPWGIPYPKLAKAAATHGATDEMLDEVMGDVSVDGIEVEKQTLRRLARRMETESGDAKWIKGHTCPIGKSWIATAIDKVKMDSEQQAKAECAAACDANDQCAYADLFYGSTATCYLRTRECGDWEATPHHMYHLYVKGLEPTPEPTLAPTDVPTHAPTNAPTSAPTGDAKWIKGHTCPIGKSWIATAIDKVKIDSEQQAKAECAAACDANDLCAYGDLFYGSTSTCYLRTKECGDWEATPHHMYHLYIKDSSDACEDLTVRTNLRVSIKRGKKQAKTMELVGKEDPICECAGLCENAGFDIFQYYSKVKRGKVQTSCKCMNVTNKVKAKTKKGYTAGALTSAAEEAFSKFKVKTSKKDQKAGQ